MEGRGGFTRLVGSCTELIGLSVEESFEDPYCFKKIRIGVHRFAMEGV